MSLTPKSPTEPVNSLDPPRLASVKDLSEEAIDLVCAFIRDDKDAQVATETLCSLTRTARLFYSPAKRALLYDPTRALANVPYRWYWPRVSSLMHQLLREPALGGHIKRIDSFPGQRRLFAGDDDDIPDEDYANWILILGHFCPSIFSLAVPIALYGDDAPSTYRNLASAYREVAGKLKLRYLVLGLEDEYDAVGKGRVLHKCQDFLAGLDLSRCESLQLPPLDVRSLVPPNRPPTLIQSASLILQDFRNVTNARVLGDYFDLRNVRSVELRESDYHRTDLSVLRVSAPELDKMTICGGAYPWSSLSWEPLARSRFPCLTQLTLGRFDLKGADLVDIVHQFPLLQSLDFTHSVWSRYVVTTRVWPESLRYVRHLKTLRTGTICCDTTSARNRLRNLITEYCQRNEISVICTVDSDEQSSDSLSSTDSSTALSDRTQLGECSGDSREVQEVIKKIRAQQAWTGEGDGEEEDEEEEDEWEEDEDNNDSAVENWRREVDATDSDVSDSLFSDNQDEPGSDEQAIKVAIKYLSPLPDALYLGDGSETLDDDGSGSDCDGFGIEPWRIWSKFCDFESADEGWVRFDTDGTGSKIGSKEGECSDVRKGGNLEA